MSLERVVALLAALAGPQGPWATHEQVEKLRGELLAGDPPTAAERLLRAVACQPPLPPSAPVTWQDVEYEATELLSVLGEHTEVRTLLVRSLDDPSVRRVAIEALALLADARAGPALAALARAHLRAPFLSELELVQLASALGCVGGADALAVVQDLRDRAWPPAIAHELDVALQAIRGY